MVMSTLLTRLVSGKNFLGGISDGDSEQNPQSVPGRKDSCGDSRMPAPYRCELSAVCRNQSGQ